MRVALVHELLTMKGGAERVMRVLAGMFPEAPITTLLYDEQKLGDWFPAHRIVTSSVQARAQFFSFNHHLYLRQFPRAVEAWDFSGFDLVISSSSAFVHGIITNSAPRHLCYVQSPARYLWDRTHEILARAGKGPLGPLRRHWLSKTFHALRVWDAETSDRPDRLLNPSKTVQRRIELYWRRESTVVHPPIDDFWLQQTSDIRRQNSDHYLIVSTLVPYKRIELAIEACNRLQRPLIIVGEGPFRSTLERLAGSTVRFLGHMSDEELRPLYGTARATLFPGDEDFGLVPLESLACGTPVIAFRGGGALETVTEATHGMFFNEETADSLASAISKFEDSRFHPDALRARAAEFSREKFEQRMREEIQEVLK